MRHNHAAATFGCTKELQPTYCALGAQMICVGLEPVRTKPRPYSGCPDADASTTCTTHIPIYDHQGMQSSFDTEGILLLPPPIVSLSHEPKWMDQHSAGLLVYLSLTAS